jgi:predicted RNase H-like nuclease
MTYVGLDGCKGGWFFISHSDGSWEHGVVGGIHEIVEAIDDLAVLLVDIPIGLRDIGEEERVCDRAARKVLEKRKSSVFPAPARPSLVAANYETGSEINRRLTGRKLSKQSWSLGQKIFEVDRLLTDEKLRGSVREIHPEICFWALNDCRPMEHPKKSEAGFDERLHVLTELIPQAEDIISAGMRESDSSGVRRDDVVDALAAAATAYLSSGSLQTIPREPETDAHGLPMEMVYWVPSASEE